MGISRGSAALYFGNRYALDPVQLTDNFPTDGADMPGTNNRRDEHEGAIRSTSGGVSVSYRRTPKSAIVDDDAEKFMRAVDKVVQERYSQSTKLPLLPAALPENESMFRSVSHDAKLIEPTYLAKLAEHVDSFGMASGRQQASDDRGCGRLTVSMSLDRHPIRQYPWRIIHRRHP